MCPPLRITTVTIDHLRSGRTARGALAGFLAGGLALGIGQLIAALISSTSSPVVAVGQLSIDLTPPPVKDFAISAFGSNDKTVLVGGILVVLAIFACVFGALALRRLAYGMIGLAVFTLVGLIAALTRPTSTATDAIPTLIGGAVAALALRQMIRAVPPEAAAVASKSPSAAGKSLPPAQASAKDQASGKDQPKAGQPGSAKLPARPPARPAGARATPPGRPPARRPPPRLPATSRPPRRTFMATGAVVGGAAVVAGLGGRLLGERNSVSVAQRTLRIPAPAVPTRPLPAGTHFDIPGLSSFITPNSSFYRVDTAIVLPEIPPASWRLRIHGMVSKEITLTFDDLIRRPLIEDYVTLCCVSNPVGGPYVGNAKWLGASMRSLLQEVGIKAGANQLLCTSTDGFTSGTPVELTMDGRDAMLAVAMNGTPLPVEHGFPVRLVVPGLYGYVSACKWITDIEVTTFADAHGYWTVRGWSQQGPIKTESRIDVPAGSAAIKAGPTAVAGVAWAQHKGIEAVEVRVDRGPWHTARLATVPGIDTWRQWTWEWPATRGQHLLEARATDRTGYTQTALQAQPAPNGASGYPQVLVSVE